MPRLKLTIGMATYDDYDGCYFSIQALRMYHDLTDCEILVVDNHPGTENSLSLKKLIKNWMRQFYCPVRYIPFSEVTGTAAPRNKIFQEAEGEAVLCMDSHVFLVADAITKLKQWYQAHPQCMDLISGPILLDDLVNQQALFVDVWEDTMWGVWGEAWQSEDGIRFTVSKRQEVNENGIPFDRAVYHALPYQFIRNRYNRFISFPLYYVGHEQELLAHGCKKLGYDPKDEFDIPGQGLGVFSCRKDAWLGFNPLFRGFGGEEMYIHEKFRNAGRRCLCLGFLKWLHRFQRPHGVPYPLTYWHKARNYVLGHLELGRPLTPVYQQFVSSGKLSQQEWDEITSNPEKIPDMSNANKSPYTPSLSLEYVY